MVAMYGLFHNFLFSILCVVRRSIRAQTHRQYVVRIKTTILILKKVYFHQYKSCNIETLIAHKT